VGFNGILTLANIVVTRSYPPVFFYIAKSMIVSPSEMTYIPGGFFCYRCQNLLESMTCVYMFGYGWIWNMKILENSIEWNGSHALYTWFNIVLY